VSVEQMTYPWQGCVKTPQTEASLSAKRLPFSGVAKLAKPYQHARNRALDVLALLAWFAPC